MRKKITILFLLAVAVVYIANSQSTLIISENFQSWEPTEDTDESTCSAGVVMEASLTRTMTLTTQSGTTDITVSMIKCGIAPECDSRRVEDGGLPENPAGITRGWVLLNKLDGYTWDNFEESPDTIGEFIFGPIPQIDSIVMGHSATGSNRGIRVYKSDDGENWERATEDEFTDGDSQAGVVHRVDIGATNVYIKFTSGFKQSDGTSQYTRLHNIDVYGIPGAGAGYIDNMKDPDIIFYYNSGSDLLMVNGKVNAINIYDCLGKVVKTVQGEDITSVSMADLRSSLYIIEAFDHNQNRIVKKIIK